MQVTVSFPDDVSVRLQQMADDEHVTVAEMIKRITERAVFATASNAPANAPLQQNGANGKTFDNLPRRWRKIMDFEGILSHKPFERDAQELINELRDEWDTPKLDADGNPL